MGERRKSTHTLVLMALLTALALVLGYVERMLPLEMITIPGVRLGLANVVVVAGIYLFPFPTAFGMALLKSCTTFLVSGSAVGFLYGFTGTLLSFIGMWLLRRLAHGGPVVLSAVGGILHSTGQVIAAVAVTHTPALFGYLPIVVVSGAATGLLVGITVKGLLPCLNRLEGRL